MAIRNYSIDSKTIPWNGGLDDKKVQEQVVAGKNYIINFATKDGSEYEFRAYHALDGKIEITEGKKNSKVIYSKNTITT